MDRCGRLYWADTVGSIGSILESRKVSGILRTGREKRAWLDTMIRGSSSVSVDLGYGCSGMSSVLVIVLGPNGRFDLG